MKGKNTFIAELATTILEENRESLNEVSVVFPNRRAGLFFRQAMAKMIDRPMWMPSVISMRDFVGQFTNLRALETLEAVFELFEVYKKHQKKESSFERFFFWGEMILRDFEEIDQYLIDPGRLFTSIKTQKELDEEFYFLDEKDKVVIQSFWSSFLPKTTKSQEAFLETWKILLPVYTDFREVLKKKGEAYGGLAYREVAENIKGAMSGRKLYFAGFNALTYAEEKIIKHFVVEENARVFWDVDDYYFSNPKQEAGLFLRGHKKDSALGNTFPKELPGRIDTPKSFFATGVSLEAGQVKALAEDLAKMARDPDFDPQNTVVVLPKEYMLFPVLHAISPTIENINITMGYPLRDTPVYSLLENVLQLQNSAQGEVFYYKPVLEVVGHPLLYVLEQGPVNALIGDIRKRNRIMLGMDEIKLAHPVFRLIFTKPEDPFRYLIDILRMLYEHWKDRGHGQELGFISGFYQQVRQLHKMIGDRAGALGYDFLIKLFGRLSGSMKTPFTGEPLNGLQVMGILETRNLDFENVFILNMNEGSWPAPSRHGSFIPFNIRKAFGLPTHGHQDAIYAYLFYRLLQRAKQVRIYHNTVSEFNINGELSRLVQQLETESGHEIKKRILASPVKTKMPDPISIEKNGAILQKMERYVEGFVGSKGNSPSRLAPSAINTYLDCGLKYYFKYVEKLYEPDEVQEEMDPMVFGNILHNSMELLYKQFMEWKGRNEIYPQDFVWIKEGVKGAVNKAFINHYGIKNGTNFKLEGRSIIAHDILVKFIDKILRHDEQYAPFRIVDLEMNDKGKEGVAFPIHINGREKRIRLKGIIDRVDIKQGKIRVIDYKTGRDEKFFDNVPSLIDRSDKKRNKAVFQVFFYCYLFMRRHKGDYVGIEPGLFNGKDLFRDDFDWRAVEGKCKKPVADFRDYLPDFEAILKEILTEIYNPAFRFEQTDDIHKCKFCAYADICGR